MCRSDRIPVALCSVSLSFSGTIVIVNTESNGMTTDSGQNKDCGND